MSCRGGPAKLKSILEKEQEQEEQEEEEEKEKEEKEEEEERSQFVARVPNLGNPLSATLVINFQFLVAKLAAWLRNDPIDI